MPTIDELAPRTVREKKLDVTLDPNDEPPRAFRAVTIGVSYERTLPAGVMLPILFEVRGPTTYQRREFTKGKPPTTVIFTPREGGRHLVTVREVAHHKWWNSLALEVEGEKLASEPLRSKPREAPAPAGPPAPPPPAGAVPLWVNTGGLVEAAADGPANVPYPGSIVAGNWLFLYAANYSGGLDITPILANGWSLLSHPGIDDLVDGAVFVRSAAGGETGTTPVTGATIGVGPTWGAIHQFSGVSDVDWLDSTADNTGPVLTIANPYSLAVACAIGYKSTAGNPANLSGATGGTWVQRYTLRAGTTVNNLMTCDFVGTGAISGGTTDSDGGRILGMVLR